MDRDYVVKKRVQNQAIVREVDDKEALELAIIENVQRVDLNPLEEAQGYGQLIDQFSYTQQDLAQVIGKSRSHVANTLRLLRLPEDVRGKVPGATRSISGRAGPFDAAKIRGATTRRRSSTCGVHGSLALSALWASCESPNRVVRP